MEKSYVVEITPWRFVSYTENDRKVVVGCEISAIKNWLIVYFNEIDMWETPQGKQKVTDAEKEVIADRIIDELEEKGIFVDGDVTSLTPEESMARYEASKKKLYEAPSDRENSWLRAPLWLVKKLFSKKPHVKNPRVKKPYKVRVNSWIVIYKEGEKKVIIDSEPSTAPSETVSLHFDKVDVWETPDGTQKVTSEEKELIIARVTEDLSEKGLVVKPVGLS